METTVAPIDKALPIVPERPFLPIRRMELADINEHGPWLLPRLQAAFPQLDPRSVIGWLTGMLYENTYMLLYHRDAVACAQLIKANAMEPVPRVQEHFIYTRDPENAELHLVALEFYNELERWTRLHDAKMYLLSARNDIPAPMVRKRFPRMFETKQVFVRLD